MKHVCTARPGGRQCRGFTLIEVLIAMLVVSTGAVTVLSMLSFSHLSNDLEQERARAHQIVCQELELAKHQLYTRLRPGSHVVVWDNGTPDNPADDTTGDVTITFRDPNGTLLTKAPDNPPVRMTVEVTMSWHPRGRMSRKLMTETVMTYIVP